MFGGKRELKYIITVEGGLRYSLDDDRDLKTLANDVFTSDVVLVNNNKVAIKSAKILSLERID